jgi:sodium transport system ATP-binding protein
MRDDGCCVLFSSHVLEEVRALCDRVVVITRGRVVTEGTTETILARTGARTFEEAFVNLIAGETPSCA